MDPLDLLKEYLVEQGVHAERQGYRLEAEFPNRSLRSYNIRKHIYLRPPTAITILGAGNWYMEIDLTDPDSFSHILALIKE